MTGVVVVGSVNMDLTVRVPRHPVPGETVLGGDVVQTHGGKGGNQAVAAARLGQAVAFVGRVGDDDVGARLRAGLADEGVDVRAVQTTPDTPSGQALITVADDAENTIVVSPGANARLSAEDVERAAGLLSAADVVLAQLEIADAAVLAAARATRGRFVLNPAPARALSRELLAHVPAVVVTLGADGALVVADDAVRLPAHPVEPVDTVGAGDAFCGALADALARGWDVVEAAGWAVRAGALATSRPGARTALPSRSALERAGGQR